LHRLTLFGHIGHILQMPRLLSASPPADWRRQPGHPRITWLSAIQQDLKQHHLIHPSIYLKSGNKAHRTGAIQRKSRFGSEEPPSVEDDVHVCHYAILHLCASDDDPPANACCCFMLLEQLPDSTTTDRHRTSAGLTLRGALCQHEMGALLTPPLPFPSLTLSLPLSPPSR